MNVILVMSDSFRRDHIGALGHAWMRTPHLDRFAREATDFAAFRVGSYPTIPQRTDMATGTFCYADRPWQALKPDDIVLAELLQRAGVATYCAADTPHLFHSGQVSFMRGFDAFHWSRGSEVDIWWSDAYAERLYTRPAGKGRIRISEERYKKLWSQGARRVREMDWTTPQTFAAAIEWLTHNAARPKFFLMIDTFDPHEPWDPPQWLVDIYDQPYEGQPYTWAEYGLASQFGARELRNLRARYAAECTFVDRWFGRLMDTVDVLGLRENTMVIFVSDHGHYLGYKNDGGQIGKWMGYRISDGKMANHDADVFVPLLDSVSNPPLLVRLPGQRKRRVCPALAQPVDLMPTVLEAMGVRAPGGIHGQSLLPLLRGQRRHLRTAAVTACHGLFAEICTPRWLYGAWIHAHPGRLYDRVADPQQTRDVARKYPDIVRRLHRQMLDELRRMHAHDGWLQALETKRTKV